MKTMKKAILAIVLAGAIALVPASAATITGLFNTGVDNMGVLLADGAIDTHYILAQNPNNASPNAFVIKGGQFPFPPFGPYLPNTSTSKWIGPVSDLQANPAEALSTCPGGMNGGTPCYDYRITFVVTGAMGVVLNGNYTSDNMAAILLNGGAAGVAGSPDMALNVFTPFSITGLSEGTNTLDFLVMNQANTPTGLQVQISSVPEPGTMMLGALGLLAVGLLRRRR